MMLDFVQEGDAANALDKMLRKEAVWTKVMGTETDSKAIGNWNDWFTNENYEKVMTRFLCDGIVF